MVLKCERCQYEGNSDEIKTSPKSIPKWYGKPICKKCYEELKEEILHGTKEISLKKQKFGKCSYHLCLKGKVRLYRCKHCKEYYCHQHLCAKIPQLVPFKSTNKDRHERWKKRGNYI